MNDINGIYKNLGVSKDNYDKWFLKSPYEANAANITEALCARAFILMVTYYCLAYEIEFSDVEPTLDNLKEKMLDVIKGHGYFSECPWRDLVNKEYRKGYIFFRDLFYEFSDGLRYRVVSTVYAYNLPLPDEDEYQLARVYYKIANPIK